MCVKLFPIVFHCEFSFKGAVFLFLIGGQRQLQCETLLSSQTKKLKVLKIVKGT